MPDFKNMHKLVTYVNDQNTKNDDDTNPDNLTDPKYERIVAVRKQDALSKFGRKNHLDAPKVARLYKDAKDLNFLKEYPHDPNENTDFHGDRVTVIVGGRNFIEQTKRLHLNKGMWLAWIDFYYKALTVLAAFIGAAALDILIRWLFSN